LSFIVIFPTFKYTPINKDENNDMRSLILICCHFLFILFLQSCNHGLNSEFEDTFSFNIVERHSDIDQLSAPELFINIFSDSSYSGSEALKSNIKIGYNTIIVNITGIEHIKISVGREGPRGTTLPLNLKNGIYRLLINYQSATDIYTISINSKSVNIEPESNSFSEPEFFTYWRYPVKSFYFYCKTTEDQKWLYQDFLDTLSSNIKIQKFTFPNYGEICFRDWVDETQDDESLQYFIYKYETDFDKVGDILNKYLMGTPDTLGYYSYSIMNWRGKLFYAYKLGDN